MLLLLAFFFGGWPQLLGPSRNGVYADTDVAWPSQFAWQKAVGSGFAAPVIANGKVILFHRRAKREVVEAFDARTGNTVWTFDYGTEYKDDFGFDNGPRSAPTVAGGRVFTFGAEGVLHALDLATGELQWRVDVHKEYKVAKGFFGAGCSPLVVGNKLYLNIGAKNAGVGAFDTATGKLLWKASSHAMSYSSPAAAPFGIVFFTREGILITDPDSGRIRYEKPWRARAQASANVATPLVDGNLLFVSSNYAAGAIVLDFSTSPPTELWSGDDAISAHYATPVIKDGVLYGLHGPTQTGQQLRAVELRTGKVLWKMLASEHGGSVTLLRGYLLFIRDDGQIFQIRPRPEEVDVVGNFKPLEGTIRAFPAVGEGLVCLRNTATLACLR
ncbi:MAG: PQQ-like beta-propeller repeat protein [Bryobacterales bacterium]|nr:PQQ-like beta-propeller repeat protein [Bryobacterales bacterium]